MNQWTVLVAIALVGCGGSSKNRTSGGDDDDAGESGSAGVGGKGSGSGAVGGKGSGATGGTGGGASGGSDAAGGSDPAGGTGGDLPLPGTGGVGASGGGGGVGGTIDVSGGVSGSVGGSGGVAGSVGGSGGVAGSMGGTLGEGGSPCGDGGCLPEPHVPTLEPPGPVICNGVACESNELCCWTTGECFDPEAAASICEPPKQDEDPWGRTVCASNADCNEYEFCQLDNTSLCQGPGHCHPMGNCGGCGSGDGSTFCRVCACDGNTYPDFQTACLARTSVTNVQGAGCGESVTLGEGGSSGNPQTVTVCALDEQCGEKERCCGVTRRCYPEADPGQCALPPEGTKFPCTSNDQCDAYQYCAADGCEGPGGCVTRDRENCRVTIEPVCGCDGTTYTSPACASERGVRVASEGECE